MPAPYLILTLTLGLLVCPSARAQSYGACPSDDHTCQAKYALYDAYLTQMGAGVALQSLAPLYQELLAPHFPSANLSEVGFGFSNRQPPNNATCDCDKIYFNDAAMVDQMSAGTLSDYGDIGWMLHELRHFEQCRQLGSREAFARLWWEHLSATELHTLITTGSWTTVHDQMQMEQDADNRAVTVLAALEACCIQPSTEQLVRPLQVSPITFSPPSPQLNQAVVAEVQATDGAEPYVFEWSWKRPSSSTFQSLMTDPAMPYRILAPVTQAGVYEVKVRVLQDGGAPSLTPHEEVRSFNVIAPQVTRIEIIPNTVESGTAAPATVYLNHLTPNSTVEVTLRSTDPAAIVPATITATANSYGAANHPFNITTAPTSTDRTATIVARLGDTPGTSASAQLNIEGVPPPTIQPRVTVFQASRPDLRSSELFELLLQLEEPAPGPVVVTLESSDPRAISLPREVRFERGERQKTLSLRATQGLTRTTFVTLRARIGRDSGGAVETRLRVRPASSRRGR